MALDGIFLYQLCGELSAAVGCHIDKIHQPSRDELLFVLRSPSFSGRLLISSKPGAARLHVTKTALENPAEPPTFCKLLRKHLGGAKLVSLTQDGLDRTVILEFSAYNELGDLVFPKLIVELFGSRPNVILCDGGYRIYDALHRSDLEKAVRLIQPGAVYTPPEKQNKLDPFAVEPSALCAAVLDCGKRLDAAFSAVIDGVSPLIARELAATVTADPDKVPSDLTGEEKERMDAVLRDFSAAVRSGGTPFLITLPGQTDAKDFSYMPIRQYGVDTGSVALGSYSDLLDEFYGRRENAARIRHQAQDIFKLIGNLKSRAERRLAFRLDDLEKSKNREHLRIWGELIKANLHAVERGAEYAEVLNYYDEAMATIKIPLNPALSPAANAAKYFKDYKKSYAAEQTLTGLIEQDKKELVYLDSVLDALSRCETTAELGEIRDELNEAGYIRRDPRVKRKATAAAPKEFISPSGLTVLVGRNNRQNDLLTLKTAEKTDLWFHTKNIPGSHVILCCGGRQPDDESLLFAARLAAANSKAALSDNVPVDFTEVKNVKKPAGAKPGMVIYTTNKTIFVRPL